LPEPTEENQILLDNCGINSELVIEIYEEIAYFNKTLESSSEEKKLIATLKTDKVLVSLHSRYLYKMLTSSMREGVENKIRLTTSYPESLRKLLQSFYDHVLEIGSAEELIEMLYLADEFDMPDVMTALKQVFPKALLFSPANNKEPISNNNDNKESPTNVASQQSSPIAEFHIGLENARMFLDCSAKLSLNWEPVIFSMLTYQWDALGPQDGLDYAQHERHCALLLDSLNFAD
jgi:hypothetical protein